MATKPKADPCPTARSVVLLLDLVAELRAEVDALKAWKDQVEAAWPQIAEVTNGTD
jgi:hypothetical protein